MTTLYHITAPKNVNSIMCNGFIPKPGTSGRVCFCKPETLEIWQEILRTRHPIQVVLEVKVTAKLYKEEFYDWDKDEFSSGPPGEVSYGEGKHGWNEPVQRPKLAHKTNCTVTVNTNEKGMKTSE